MTDIYELREGSTDMRLVATYSVPPKQALICYIKQFLYSDYNIWEYPEIIDGMRESQTVKDHWYFDRFKRDFGGYEAVLSAYPR